MSAYLVQAFEGVAADMAARFAEGARCRVRGSGTVHDVRSQQWIGGLDVPAPGCGIGISGFDLAAIEPTDEPVNCLRCLRRHDADLEAAGQMTIFDLAA